MPRTTQRTRAAGMEGISADSLVHPTTRCERRRQVTGTIAGAKNPRKWGNFFDFRAACVEPPERGSKLPPVRLTLPDWTVVTSEQPDLVQILSEALGHEVDFAEAQGDGEASGAQAEEYWPDMEGLDTEIR